MKQESILQQNPYLPRPYTVLNFFRETEDNFTLTVGMKINHEPGQFVQVSMPGFGECPISISSDSREHIMLNVREVGNVTKVLSKIKKGSTIFIRGPYGKGYPMKVLKGNNILIIGGGCGVAPLKGVIEYIGNHRENYGEVHLFLGYRSPREILFRKETELWKKRYKVDISVDTVPQGQTCQDMRVGFITNALKETALNNENKVVFICGPGIMIKLVVDILKEKGFHDDQIFISTERLMYCAQGICCHCMIRGKFTCIDGPVFRYDQIKDFKND